MTKEYVVLKEFQDRCADFTIRSVGEKHIPPTEERAQLLLEQGYIGVPTPQPTTPPADDSEGDEDRIKHVGGGYWELPNGEKVRGKEHAVEALKALDAASGQE